jgi:cell division septal protein FtsQ
VNRGEGGEGGSRFTFEGIFLGALLVFAAHQFHYLLFDASYFKLQRIQITGLKRLTEKQILDYSGLELGMAAFRVDDQMVRERVLRNPKVGRCVIEQPSPNTLRLYIEEKPEVARIVLQGSIYEVSGNGEIMLEAGFDSETPLLLDAEVEEGPPAN